MHCRQLRRRPAFWSTVVITLVVGIATTTTMFAIVNGVLLRPLPYRQPDRLVFITDVGFRGVYLEMRQRMTTLDVGAFMARAPMSLTGVASPSVSTSCWRNARLFDVLGVGALLGRRFFAGDVQPARRRRSFSVTACGSGASESDRSIIGRRSCSTGWPTRCFVSCHRTSSSPRTARSRFRS
jgi:hypothetical protein